MLKRFEAVIASIGLSMAGTQENFFLWTLLFRAKCVVGVAASEALRHPVAISFFIALTCADASVVAPGRVPASISS